MSYASVQVPIGTNTLETGPLFMTATVRIDSDIIDSLAEAPPDEERDVLIEVLGDGYFHAQLGTPGRSDR